MMNWKKIKLKSKTKEVIQFTISESDLNIDKSTNPKITFYVGGNSKDALEINIELEDKEISQIINSKPYNQQKFLLDTKKVNNYREGLVTSLLEVEKEYIKINKRLTEIKKENNLTYKLDLTKQ